MNKERSEFEKKLEKSFQALSSKTIPPAEIKKEVFKSIDRINAAADFIDLFVIKFPQTEITLLNINDHKKREQ